MAALLAALCVVLVLAAGAGTPTGGAGRPTGRCPDGKVFRSGTLDGAIRAARRLLVVGRTMRSQGVTHHLTVANTPVLAAVELAPLGAAGEIAGAPALRRKAALRCGARLAAAAWAVVIDYPFSQIAANSVRVSFLVLTSRGWKTF